MVQQITAPADANLFSFPQAGNIVPVTYRDLTVQLRSWLSQIGVQNPEQYSSHSLRRGGTTHAFNNGLPEQTIQILGNWASQCYRRYIEITVETRLQAIHVISNPQENADSQ